MYFVVFFVLYLDRIMVSGEVEDDQASFSDYFC